MNQQKTVESRVLSILKDCPRARFDDTRPQWKSDEFKRDLDDVINALRSEEYGLLQSRSQMVRYGRENKESEMQGAYTTEFGFRADTEKYAFVLRCNPSRGDYNFYCLCYVKEWLDKHIEEANRDIRFIDSHYKTYQNVLQLWEGSYLSRTAQSFYDWGVIAQHFEAMRLLGELQDTMKPLPSIDGQLSLMTAGAEERKPSAFTFSQEIIDAVLTRGSGISEGKMRIYEQFHKSLSAKENADFLKNEYGWGGVYPAIVGADIDEQHDGKGIRISKGIGSDKPHIDLKWSQVEKRIAELIKLDRYLNLKEKAQYPEWLQRQEERRAALAEERRNREILPTAPSEKAEPKNERYEYHLGSTVYLGANEYEILSFDDERVMLYDRVYQLYTDGRISFYAPADYRARSDISRFMKQIIDEIASREAMKTERKVLDIPANLYKMYKGTEALMGSFSKDMKSAEKKKLSSGLEEMKKMIEGNVE